MFKKNELSKRKKTSRERLKNVTFLKQQFLRFLTNFFSQDVQG